MLKNISNLKGAQKMSKTAQQAITGGKANPITCENVWGAPFPHDGTSSCCVNISGQRYITPTCLVVCEGTPEGYFQSY